MAKPQFIENPHFREYEDLLIQLHQLFREGKEDSAEAEALRERMEVAGSWLSPMEADRLGGLSGDLYMLANDETYEEVEGSEQALKLAEELQSALERRQWDRVLALLRKRPSSAAPARVAELRAIAYHQLGHPAAVEFARYAVSHDPRSYHGKFLLLDLLDALNSPDEAVAAASEFSVEGVKDAWWLVRYTALLLRQDPDQGALRHWRKVRAYLDWVLHLPTAHTELTPGLRFFAILSLAIAHDRSGDKTSARQWVERFLALEPVNAEGRELQSMLRSETVEQQSKDRWSVVGPALMSGMQRQPQTIPSGTVVYQVAA